MRRCIAGHIRRGRGCGRTPTMVASIFLRLESSRASNLFLRHHCLRLCVVFRRRSVAQCERIKCAYFLYSVTQCGCLTFALLCRAVVCCAACRSHQVSQCGTLGMQMGGFAEITKALRHRQWRHQDANGTQESQAEQEGRGTISWKRHVFGLILMTETKARETNL